MAFRRWHAQYQAADAAPKCQAETLSQQARRLGIPELEALFA